jgi:hypothetical protein
MSEEQRNEPSEEAGAPIPATPGAGSHAADLTRETGATGKTGGTGTGTGGGSGGTGGTDENRSAGTATGAASASIHDVAEGSPRYADRPDEIPLPGSELSWSAAPHPGYVADPGTGYTPKRLAAGVLIGCLVLALGVFFATHLLTGRSSNGNGPAPWTAAVRQDGAVVGGINAQNADAAPGVALPAGVAFGGSTTSGDALSKATATCQASTGNSGRLTATSGTAASVGAWAARATPTIGELRADAEKLGAAVADKDRTAATAAADTLCSALPKVRSLPALPDAAGAQAWSGAVTAYAQGANNALKGAGGDQAAFTTAADNVRSGNAELDTLSARINAAH